MIEHEYKYDHQLEHDHEFDIEHDHEFDHDHEPIRESPPVNDPTPNRDARRTLRDHLNWKVIPVIGLTALILYVLVGHLADAGEFSEALASARWEWIGASLVLMVATFLLQGIRFRIALDAAGFGLSLRRLIVVLLQVWPFVLIAPARINDLLRAVALRDEVPPSTCLGSVVAERFVDVQTLCLFGMAGCLLLGTWLGFAALAGLWLVAWTLVVATVINVERVVTVPVLSRFEEKLRAFLGAFEALRDRPLHLAGLFATSALVWVGAMLNLGLLFWIFGVAVDPAAIVGLWPLALFAGMLPLTIGGLGTRDAAFLGLLVWATGWAGAESAVLAATFGYGVILVILPGVVGLPMAIRWMLGGNGGR